jgi:ethanolamine utilization protein EutP (predicted NTPase)
MALYIRPCYPSTEIAKGLEVLCSYQSIRQRTKPRKVRSIEYNTHCQNDVPCCFQIQQYKFHISLLQHTNSIPFLTVVKGTGRVHSRIGHEGTERE